MAFAYAQSTRQNAQPLDGPPLVSTAGLQSPLSRGSQWSKGHNRLTMKANSTLNVHESNPGVVPNAGSRVANAAWTGMRSASIDPIGASLLARISSSTFNATVAPARGNESRSAADQPLNAGSGQPREVLPLARVLGHQHLRAILIPVCLCSGLVSGCLTPQTSRKASSTTDTFANAGPNAAHPRDVQARACTVFRRETNTYKSPP